MIQYLRSGVIFTAIGKYSNVLIQLVINAVLSRLLNPYDYGVVSVIQVFLLFFTTLADAGLSPAIIQNKTLTEYDNRVLFTYSIILSVILGAIFALLSPAVAWFYQDSQYVPLTLAMSLVLIAQGVNMVPNALMDKAKRFKEVNIRLVIANMCGGVAGIICAFCGMGAYALIISFLVPPIIAFVLNLWLLRIRPSRHTDRRSLDKIWKFAKSQFGFNFVNYFSRNTDKILVGRWMGPAALGNYAKSYQLLMMPNQVLMGVLNPVLLPVLSDYQDDVAYVRDTYMKIVRILALIGVPLSVFLCFESRDIVFFLYGDQWTEAVIPFAILALTVWIQMTLSSTGAIFQTLGQTRYLFMNGCITAVLLISATIVGCLFGNLVSLAISLSVGFLLNFIVIYWMMMVKTLHSSFGILLKQFIKPTIIAILLAIVMYVMKLFIPDYGAFVNLVIYTFVFAIILFAMIFALGEWRMFYRFLVKDKKGK
ncbi:lipopolysaccharide biosynthesis protein [Bifidobacterium pseudolongum]|uniref:lipopolysaccharide biosynthesis protein n=1 Tax=Bifidobacterium pseudolongum TaxID=1694 RepID=UPI001DC93198|nr:lipopolysaccharide biosynthesis protein [Bifidobacterium pseudolongum subsp. globosum]